MRYALVAASVGLAAACCGCALRRPAAAPVAREPAPKLGVALSGDTFVLGWDSVAGREYTVLYTERLVAPEWKPLQGCMNMRGSGGRLEARDDAANSAGRYYRLHVGRYP